jgi:hypothetical protein
MTPLALNLSKSAEIGNRKIDLATCWSQDGLLSDAIFKAVSEERKAE